MANEFQYIPQLLFSEESSPYPQGYTLEPYRLTETSYNIWKPERKKWIWKSLSKKSQKYTTAFPFLLLALKN